jgi:phage terminase large subunit GpA-like protein
MTLVSAPASPVSPPEDFSDIAYLIGPLAGHWTPPVRLPLSQWAEKNITLSSEYAARASSLRLFGWQRDILDAFTDPRVSRLVTMCSTQMIKTLLIQCAIAYVICEDPGPILLVEPKEPDAKKFSRKRLAPMIRDNECLRYRISDATHDGANRLLDKEFPGGSISMVGSISPGNLSALTIRFLFCDEVDKYPLNAGGGGETKIGEGDPLDLAAERMATYGSRKKEIHCCSPTLARRSRIGKSYASSDRRRPWVACPYCHQYQLLRFFPGAGNRGGVKFDSSLPHKDSPSTARYACAHCPALWTDIERKSVCDKAVWRAERPFNGVAGFWISHLYSPWKSMADIVAHFLRVKSDRQQYQVFVNTVLAEEWQDEGEVPDYQKLYDRREDYPFGDDCVIPQRGLFLTAACDVQESPPRLEVELTAWGRGRESWSMGYWVIQAYAENGQLLPVTSPEVWDKLDALLQKDWQHESGKTLPILLLGIDTGKLPKPVYDFARKHPQLAYGPQGVKLHTIRTVVPLKGTDDELRIISKVSKEDAIRKRQGVRIYSVGTICAKGEIYDSLKNVVPIPNGSLSGLPSPRCQHFPRYELSYFEGVCSEVRVIKPNGDLTYEKRGERNEPLDLRVYNRSLAAIVGVDRLTEEQWASLERAVEPVIQKPSTSDSLVESSRVASSPAPHVPSPGAGVVTTVSSQSASAPAPPPLVAKTQPPPSAPLRRPTRSRFF